MVCGEHPVSVTQMDVLGTVIDEDLSLQCLLDRTCAKLIKGAQELSTQMNDIGLGIPFQSAQFSIRVESSALHGAELLASYGGGWRHAAQKLNDAMYVAAKALLGLQKGTSLGSGGGCSPQSHAAK